MPCFSFIVNFVRIPFDTGSRDCGVAHKEVNIAIGTYGLLLNRLDKLRSLVYKLFKF